MILKPGEKFECYPVNGTVNGTVDYLFIVSGKYIFNDSILGSDQNTSPEIPFNTLIFKKENVKKPDAVDVTIEVLAIDDNNKVIGEGEKGGFQISKCFYYYY